MRLDYKPIPNPRRSILIDSAQEPQASIELFAARHRLANILFLYFQIEELDDRAMLCSQGLPLREVQGLTIQELRSESGNGTGAGFLSLLAAAAYRQTAAYLFSEIEQHCQVSKLPFPWDSVSDDRPMYIKCDTHAAMCCVNAAKEQAISDVKSYYDSEHWMPGPTKN